MVPLHLSSPWSSLRGADMSNLKEENRLGNYNMVSRQVAFSVWKAGLSPWGDSNYRPLYWKVWESVYSDPSWYLQNALILQLIGIPFHLRSWGLRTFCPLFSTLESSHWPTVRESGETRDSDISWMVGIVWDFPLRRLYSSHVTVWIQAHAGTYKVCIICGYKVSYSRSKPC